MSCPYVLCPSCNDGMGKTSIASSESEEQLSTKLRTLLQPRKNRDLFDLNERLKQLAMNRDKLTACFDDYLKLEGNRITRATAEQRMQEKRTRSLTDRQSHRRVTPEEISKAVDEASVLDHTYAQLLLPRPLTSLFPILGVMAQTDEPKDLPLRLGCLFAG
jgi:hypothetical protein